MSGSATRARDEREIGTADLQLLLHREYDERLLVLSAKTESLLPPGENFACALFRLRATIKRSEGDPQEVVHAVAKCYPVAPEVLSLFDFSLFFEKEIFFYERLAPTYADLERKYTGEPDAPLDIAPKLLGFRKSLEKGKETVDDGVVVLMENLKIQEYYTLDKIKGMDLEHSRLAIKSLARFHALGIACKHHLPEFWENEVVPRAKVVPFQKVENHQEDVFDSMYTLMTKDERIAAHAERIRPMLAPELKDGFFGYVAPEPWLSVVHLDFWTNNIMYKADEAGRPVTVKFVDFQNYAYNSPLRDLPYFLCSSTSIEVMDNHFDKLLDLYYETFVGVLERMKCDTKLFSRESFDKQLKIDAGFEFFHNVLAIKFFCAEIDKNTYDPSQMEEVVLLSEVNQTGYDKWYNIVLTYMKKGWI